MFVQILARLGMWYVRAQLRYHVLISIYDRVKSTLVIAICQELYRSESTEPEMVCHAEFLS